MHSCTFDGVYYSLSLFIICFRLGDVHNEPADNNNNVSNTHLRHIIASHWRIIGNIVYNNVCHDQIFSVKHFPPFVLLIYIFPSVAANLFVIFHFPSPRNVIPTNPIFSPLPPATPPRSISFFYSFAFETKNKIKTTSYKKYGTY